MQADFTGEVVAVRPRVYDDVKHVRFEVSDGHTKHRVTERLGPEVREYEPNAGKTFAEHLLLRYSDLLDCKATEKDFAKNAEKFIGMDATVTFTDIFDEDTKSYRSVPDRIYFDGEERPEEMSFEDWANA